MRDDFSQVVRRSLIVSGCSVPIRNAGRTPQDRRSTPARLSILESLHISRLRHPVGRRFDACLSDKERAGAKNGIWLCQNCAKLIDSDPARFSAAVLLGWKLVSSIVGAGTWLYARRKQWNESRRIKAERNVDLRVLESLQNSDLWGPRPMTGSGGAPCSISGVGGEIGVGQG